MTDRPRFSLAHFLLRNLVLYFLLVNSFLQLHEQLDLTFQSAAFLLGAAFALWMERGRLRFLPALLVSCLLPFGLRAVFFLVFRFQRVLAAGPDTDFLFLLFDKDFLPSLAPFAVAWLFNFMALRFRVFLFVEVALNALLLLLVFWSQAGYRLDLYPHPSILANLLALFVVAEFFALMLAHAGEVSPRGAAAGRPSARSLLSFSWIVLPLLLLFLFFLLGKYSEGAVKAGGGLMKPTLFRFDFSPFIRLESEIRMSDETVLLFRTQGIADRWLLKRFVLSGYDPGRGFFMEKAKGMDEYPGTMPDSALRFPDPGYHGRQEVDQEFFFLTLDPTSLIALDYPLEAVPLKNWKSSSFLRVYSVRSRVTLAREAPVVDDASASMRPDVLSFYTDYGGDGEIKSLAEKVTEGESEYGAKVEKIQNYLKNEYLYSLKPGIAEDGNQLHHFLFNSRKGYCSYFAFAMALMCRSLGIPARVAVGFYVDPRMEVLNFYEVRAFQAHAWVEVYFGDMGWIQFDPTSERLAPGEQFNFYTGPDRDKLARLIREIFDHPLVRENDVPEVPAPVAGAVSEAVRAFRLLARLWYVTLPVLYLLYLLCIKLLPSLPGLLFAGERRRARSLYRLSVTTLKGAGISRRPAESLQEFGFRVQAQWGIGLPAVTDGYLKAVFAPGFAPRDLAALREARSALLAAYRARVNLLRRLMGLLNPLAAFGACPRAEEAR